MELSLINGKCNNGKAIKINPIVNLMGLILLSLLSTSFAILGNVLILILVIVLLAFSKINLLSLLWKTKLLLFFVPIIGVTSFLSSGKAIASAEEAIRFLTIISLSLSFIAITDSIHLSYSLSVLLKPILGKYAIRLSSAVMLTLSLVPLVFSTSSRKLNAFKARSSHLSRHPFKMLSLYLTTTLLSLFEKATSFEDALLARAFDEKAPRLFYKLKSSDILIMACMIILFLLLKLIGEKKFFPL